MSYGPCQNPSCKSYGKPHPNCKCYGEMADGGEVYFCSKDQKHNRKCEYFADGGDTFDPDAYLNQNTQTQQTGFDPDAYLNEQTQSSTSGFDPDAYLKQQQNEQYSTPNQQILAGIEGAGRGVLGPTEALLSNAGQQIAPNVEKMLGFAPEDIAARQAANPEIATGSQIAGLIGGLASPIGLGKLALKGAVAGAEAANLGTIGTAALTAAINNGLLQGSDEINKGLLGQGDPTHPVGAALANIGGAALLGVPFGTVAGLFSNKLSQAAESSLGNKMADFVKGFGASSQGQEAEDGASKAFKIGQRAYNAMTGGLDAWGGFEGAKEGYEHDGVIGAIKGALEGGAATHAIQHYAMPVILRVISNGNVDKMGEALDYANNVNSGAQKIVRGVNNIFNGTAQQAYNGSKDDKNIKKWLDQGGLQQDINQTQFNQNNQSVPKYADGGEVANIVSPKSEGNDLLDNSGLGHALPEHHLAIQAAKGRVNNYLRSLQPSKITNKLPYDDEIKDQEKEDVYNRATKIAADPLNILNEIKNGTLEKEHIQHLQGMYPEVNQILKDKINQRIAQDQLNAKKKPSYQLRQTLGTFLGEPLSSDMKQPYIQAAQSTFILQQGEQQQQQAAPMKKKKGTAPLSKAASQFMTDQQARVANGQKQ